MGTIVWEIYNGKNEAVANKNFAGVFLHSANNLGLNYLDYFSSIIYVVMCLIINSFPIISERNYKKWIKIANIFVEPIEMNQISIVIIVICLS